MRTAICSSTAPQGGDGEDRADLPRAVPSVNYAREGTIAITQYLKQAPEIGVTLVRHRADSYRAHGAEARRRPAGALLRCRLHRKYAPPYTRPTRHDQCRDAFLLSGCSNFAGASIEGAIRTGISAPTIVMATRPAPMSRDRGTWNWMSALGQKRTSLSRVAWRQLPFWARSGLTMTP